MILRLYEWAGGSARAVVRSDLTIQGAWLTDLMESVTKPLPLSGNVIEVVLKPFEVVTLKVVVVK